MRSEDCTEDRKIGDQTRQEWKPGPEPGLEVAEYNHPCGGPVTLKVDQCSAGPVTVRGWDQSEVRVLATKGLKDHGPFHDAGGARKAVLDEGQLFIEAEGDVITVETRRDRHWSFWDSERVVIAIEAWVPRKSRVFLDSGSGRVEIHETLGPVDVDSGSGGVLVSRAAERVDLDLGSGSVTVEEVQGQVKVDVGSGSVVISRVKGSVEVDGSSGSANLSEVEGPVEVDTASGSVKMVRIIGDVSVDTGSGRVQIDALRARSVNIDTGSGSIEADLDILPHGRYVFDTGSGRIALTVPDDASFRLSAETGSGRIDCLLPLTISQADRGSLMGTLGDGSATIAADTSSGGVVIRGRSGERGDKGPRGFASGAVGLDAQAAVRQLKTENRNAILKMIADGKLTAAQGEALLLALAEAGELSPPMDSPTPPAPPPEPPPSPGPPTPPDAPTPPDPSSSPEPVLAPEVQPDDLETASAAPAPKAGKRRRGGSTRG